MGFFFFAPLLLLPFLLVICKIISVTLQAASRWQVSGLVEKLGGKLSGLPDHNTNEQSLLGGMDVQPAQVHSPHIGGCV